MKKIGTYASNCGKKALVLISKGGYKRIGKMIEDSFAESTCEVVFDYFNGECCTSEIDRLVNIVKENQCDLVMVSAEARSLIQRKQLHIMQAHRYLSARRSHQLMHRAVHCPLFIQKKVSLKNICSFRPIRIWF